MARRVFFSFHHAADAWRVSQIRNVGITRADSLRDNEWEKVQRRGDAAIQRWIDNQLNGCSCTVVLVGAKTASRRWIKYEIKKSWEDGKGVVGVRIHNLKGHDQKTSDSGDNPFEKVRIDGKPLSDLVQLHDPWIFTLPLQNESAAIYEEIATSLPGWVEAAIDQRERLKPRRKSALFGWL